MKRCAAACGHGCVRVVSSVNASAGNTCTGGHVTCVNLVCVSPHAHASRAVLWIVWVRTGLRDGLERLEVVAAAPVVHVDLAVVAWHRCVGSAKYSSKSRDTWDT
eukprot:6184975-Pleurochrysis_carterae.AAC.3